jgi:hypothetical protein
MASPEYAFMGCVSTDVKDLLGPTLTVILKESNAKKSQYIPFAGRSRRSGLKILQEMYSAYREQGQWIIVV